MVKTLPSSGWGVGSIPGWGTKDSHAIDWDQKLFVFFFFQCQLIVQYTKA